MSYPSVMREKLNRWDDHVYRVCLPKPPETRVVVMHFGVEKLDEQYCGTYDSADALPMWIQERLAVLMMTPTEFPTVEIPTVGRRISEYVFWVFAPGTPPDVVAYLPVSAAAAIYPAKAPSIDLLHLSLSHLKESRK